MNKPIFFIALWLIPIAIFSQNGTSAVQDTTTFSLQIENSPLSIKEGEEYLWKLREKNAKGLVTYTAEGTLPEGASFDQNVFVWKPSYRFVSKQQRKREQTFSFIAQDNSGQIAYTSLVVTVQDVNRSPRINPASLYVTIIPNKKVEQRIVATDEDGDPIHFSQVGILPTGVQLSGEGMFSWTATPTQYDRLPLKIPVKIQDDSDEPQVYELVLGKYDAGLPPTLTLLSLKKEINEGEKVIVSAQVYDPDGLDDLTPIGIAGDTPPDYVLKQNNHVYTFTWAPPFDFVNPITTPTKRRAVQFTLYVVDKNGNRAELPIAFDVLDAPDHENIYRQYQNILTEVAQEMAYIQQLQSALIAKTARAEQAKNRRIIMSLALGAVTAIWGTITTDRTQTLGTAIGGGLNALLAGLERTTIFSNPTQVNADSDKLSESLIDLRVKSSVFAYLYGAKEKRTKTEYPDEYAKILVALQQCRVKTTPVVQKYNLTNKIQMPIIPLDDVKQFIPGFSADPFFSFIPKSE
jgi:hypothetical protein